MTRAPEAGGEPIPHRLRGRLVGLRQLWSELAQADGVTVPARGYSLQQKSAA